MQRPTCDFQQNQMNQGPGPAPIEFTPGKYKTRANGNNMNMSNGGGPNHSTNSNINNAAASGPGSAGPKRELNSEFYIESETRLFVGGMGPTIRESELREYFEQFGALSECSLKSDIFSGKSKGYAFLSYENVEAIFGVLNSRPHILNDRVLDVKRAREIAEIAEPCSEGMLKIFVGALPETCTADMLKTYFSKYGHVRDAVVIGDHESGQSRGFGFVNFSDVSEVKKVLEDYHEHFLENKWIETKCCLPRGKGTGGGQQQQNGQQQAHGGTQNSGNVVNNINGHNINNLNFQNANNLYHPGNQNQNQIHNMNSNFNQMQQPNNYGSRNHLNGPGKGNNMNNMQNLRKTMSNNGGQVQPVSHMNHNVYGHHGYNTNGINNHNLNGNQNLNQMNPQQHQGIQGQGMHGPPHPSLLQVSPQVPQNLNVTPGKVEQIHNNNAISMSVGGPGAGISHGVPTAANNSNQMNHGTHASGNSKMAMSSAAMKYC